MRVFLLVWLLAGTVQAQEMHLEDGIWLNEAGGNIFGNSILNPEANPILNPEANPIFNPEANPVLNPEANPVINPKANPILFPMGLPMVDNEPEL